MLLMFHLWTGADLADDSTDFITTSAQNGFCSVRQDECVIIVALDSLNDKLCFP